MTCGPNDCPNSQHDHFEMFDIPMRCADCGQPAHYDYDVEAYCHDDPKVGCFLIAPEGGATVTEIDRLALLHQLTEKVRSMLADWASSARTNASDQRACEESEYASYWRGRAFAYEEAEAHLGIAIRRALREEVNQ